MGCGSGCLSGDLPQPELEHQRFNQRASCVLTENSDCALISSRRPRLASSKSKLRPKRAHGLRATPLALLKTAYLRPSTHQPSTRPALPLSQQSTRGREDVPLLLLLTPIQLTFSTLSLSPDSCNPARLADSALHSHRRLPGLFFLHGLRLSHRMNMHTTSPAQELGSRPRLSASHLRQVFAAFLHV